MQGFTHWALQSISTQPLVNFVEVRCKWNFFYKFPFTTGTKCRKTRIEHNCLPKKLTPALLQLDLPNWPSEEYLCVDTGVLAECLMSMQKCAFGDLNPCMDRRTLPYPHGETLFSRLCKNWLCKDYSEKWCKYGGKRIYSEKLGKPSTVGVL